MLRWICLIVSLTLSACAGLRPFPAKKLWEYDRKDRVCGEYEILEWNPRLKFRHLRDVPLDQCPAIFGFTSVDTPKVLNWSEDAVKYAKEKCK